MYLPTSIKIRPICVGVKFTYPCLGHSRRARSRDRHLPPAPSRMSHPNLILTPRQQPRNDQARPIVRVHLSHAATSSDKELLRASLKSHRLFTWAIAKQPRSKELTLSTRWKATPRWAPSLALHSAFQAMVCYHFPTFMLGWWRERCLFTHYLWSSNGILDLRLRRALLVPRTHWCYLHSVRTYSQAPNA